MTIFYFVNKQKRPFLTFRAFRSTQYFSTLTLKIKWLNIVCSISWIISTETTVGWNKFWRLKLSAYSLSPLTLEASVSFSSCQPNLIRTFQIEAMITKMVLIFSWDLLNGQKYTSKSAKIWFSKSILNVKNHQNLSKNFFHCRISIWGHLFCFY